MKMRSGKTCLPLTSQFVFILSQITFRKQPVAVKLNDLLITYQICINNLVTNHSV